MSITVKVAPCGTHHTLGGKPLYEARYDWVLAYHRPGLAPVGRDGLAWHIDQTGQDAYPHRFLRTFGFYDERAAVVAEDGWHHILPDGKLLYEERYPWVGNFQGWRCAVRDSDGRYFHLDPQGRPAYSQRYRYVGDFRDGLAVVQRNDGLSLHIDAQGEPLNGTTWQDLDVFHKGFARARDGKGWTHIDKAGQPLYPQRYAVVEPFYNGQARVEEASGRRLVIDESGCEVLELRPAQRSDFAELSGDMVGYWRTHTLGAAAELSVLDALPATTGEVAERCGLPVSNAERLLAALGELGLVERRAGAWQATHKGSFLRAGHPTSLRTAALEYARHMARPWEGLADLLRSSPGARDDDLFQEVADDPARRDGFHEMLSAYARHDYPGIGAALDLGHVEHLIDAGGGAGVVAGFLLAAHPGLKLHLLDRPEVLARVDLPPDLRTRLHPVPADLFSPWPLRADAVLMARVLHDWDDARCLRILRHARNALSPGGDLYLVEMLLDPGSFDGHLCDLHLLVNTGGAERSEKVYADMLAQCGFQHRGTKRLGSLPSILHAVAV